MKQIYFIIVLIIGLAFSTLVSCKKEISSEVGKLINKTPVVNSGKDTLIKLPSDSARLDGSASYDQDGTITVWLWKKIEGPSTFTIVSESSPKTTVTSLKAGVYKFELTATDNAGASAKDTIVITVDDLSNHPPVAYADQDLVITLPVNSTILDGRNSYDPDNNIIAYQWMKIAGPASFNIVNTTAAITMVTNLVVGNYQFELTVSDAGGSFMKDTVQVAVLSAIQSYTICDSTRAVINAQLIPFGKLWKPKSGLAAAYVGNKIVFAGGVEAISMSGISESSSVDIYDLATQSWSFDNLSAARKLPAVAVNGNNIFFAGGGYFYSDYFNNIDIYDGLTNTWTTTILTVPKTGVAGASVGDKVLFAGGFKYNSDFYPDNFENLVEIYQLSTHSWSTVTLSVARGFISAVTVKDKVYFAGGTNIAPSNKIDIYNNATNSWSVSTLSFLSTANNAVAMGDQIFWTQNGSCDVEIRNTTTGISRLEHLSRSTQGEIIGVVKDNKIAFIRPGSAYFDIYNTTNKEWSVGILPEAILPGASIISANNVIYIAGGTTGCTPFVNGSCIPVFTDQVWKLEF